MTTAPGTSSPDPGAVPPSRFARAVRIALGVVLTAAIVSSVLVVVFRYGPGGGAQAAVDVRPVLSRVAAGDSHSCAVTADGHVKCWGSNDNGQLGDGTFARRPSATTVPGLERVTAVATGSGSHTCALTDAGAVKCWGSNEFGQLGNGDTAASSIPVQVLGLESGALSIAVGRSHSCAVTGKGLVCWGSNQLGELGVGSLDASSVPQVVEGFGANGTVALGDASSCAIDPLGRVFCWGDDGDGQLGDKGFTATGTPLRVDGVPPAVAVSVSDTHACVVTAESDVWCWGSNVAGQLGRGSVSASEPPAPVPGVHDVVAVSAGLQRTCAVHRDQSTTCWGRQLGAPSEPQPTPVPGDLGSAVLELSLGTFHGCLRTTEAVVKCWGANTTGQLGDGSTTPSAQPVTVSGF